MTPEENARQARGNAALTYREYASAYCIAGDRLHDIDADGAVAQWLDGMHSLDAAIEVEKGLNPWQGTAFGSS